MKPGPEGDDREKETCIPPEFEEFLPGFIGSAREHIEAIDQGLLKLEKGGVSEKDASKSIWRNAHSLKGAAMTMGIDPMADICHAMEDLIRKMDEGSMAAAPEIFDALFQANDMNNAILEHLAAPSAPPVDVASILLRLEGMANPQKGIPSIPASAARGDRSFRNPSPKDASHGSVRVPTKKVDRFLNIAVELVITRNRMQSLVEKFHEPESQDLHDSVEILSHLVDETQQLVMDIRMLPISLLFNPFSRSVRDLARERNKSVDLVIQGGDTRVDKRAIEELSDPLLHLLRNAIDHGMEPSDERRAAHKDETGKITLRAFQGIDKTIIEVIDDGPGIDRERVKEKALKKKLITEKESKHMLDAEVFDILFMPGFSTAEMVTDLSGRGVGMDVVKNNVEKLSGSVEILSTLGQGTIVRIAIPLTLATAKAFLVRCSKHILALPIFSAVQVLRLQPCDIQTVKGREAIYWQGEIIPCARLNVLLSFPETDLEEPDEKRPFLLLKHGGKRIAFQVDDVMGVEEIVMRNLGSHLGRLPVFSGSSILGTGEIALIIDVARLFTMAQIKAGNLFLERNMSETPKDTRQRILLVEDQMTTRLLEKSILEAAGFLVETAEDGIDALEKLETTLFHLVMTDVQMPNMDGFTLTETLKKDTRFSQIPVIIVTSLEREEERKQGLLAGADAFLLKKSFNQESLIQTIRTLIG